MFIQESDIISQLKEGNEKAYHYLFTEYYVLLCKMASACLKDDFLAETIVGNVIVNIWERRATLDISISLRAYLVRAVRNGCINYLRQQYVQREKRVTLTDELVDVDYNQFSEAHYPLASLYEQELETHINKAVSNLPKECKQVFCMSRFQNLSYSEIAEKLDISVNTVKYHMKNALARLESELRAFIAVLLLLFLS